ncbi:MAG: DUF4116 domain-containing protein [Cytophagaceae bacterium]|nr:MAG: DUF4116 domain-containing protein [Cytophagaceae bacterium]
MSNRADVPGALRHILSEQDRRMRNDDDTNFMELCAFFCKHAPRSVLNQAIRSLFACLGVTFRREVLRNMKRDYISLFAEVQFAEYVVHEVGSRRGNMFRCALIVCLAYGNLNYTPRETIRNFMQHSTDEQLWMMAAQVIAFDRHRTSAAIRDNRMVVLTFFRFYKFYGYYYFNLGDISERLRADRQVVLAAVARQGYDLEYASAELRDDIEVVRCALGKSGSALQHASKRLRDREDIVLLAVQNSRGNAFEYASDRLKQDRDFALKAISLSEGGAFSGAAFALRDDLEFVTLALQLGADVTYASDRVYELLRSAASAA